MIFLIELIIELPIELPIVLPIELPIVMRLGKSQVSESLKSRKVQAWSTRWLGPESTRRYQEGAMH